MNATLQCPLAINNNFNKLSLQPEHAVPDHYFKAFPTNQSYCPAVHNPDTVIHINRKSR